MCRAALVLVTTASLAACGGGGGGHARTTAAPSSQATELAAVASCDDRTLAAFDPGLPAIERGAIEQRKQPDAPLAREYERPCELAEDDDVCQARARRDVLAADPGAVIGDVAIEGSREAAAPEPSAPIDPALQPRLVRVPPVRVPPVRVGASGGGGGAGTLVLRDGGLRDRRRRAIVDYEVAVPRVEERVQWEATLRWPMPPDVPAALEQLEREVERAKLQLLRYEVEADAVTAVIACS